MYQENIDREVFLTTKTWDNNIKLLGRGKSEEELV